MRFVPWLALIIVLSCNTHDGKDKQSDTSGLSPFIADTDKPILVSAHRGDWRNAPENSLEGLALCIKMGVDIMETDIKITKDGHLILMHDKTLDRTTTGHGNVIDWTLDSLRDLTLRNGYGYPTPYKIPTLEEALIMAKGKIMLDLDKSYPYFREVYRIVKKTNTLDQVIFRVNDSWENLNLKHGDILPCIHYMPLVWWETQNPKKYITAFLNASNPPYALEVIFKSEDSRQFLAYQQFVDVSCRIMMNSVYPHLCATRDDYKSLNNPDENWGWLIDNGANIIGTDRPAKLMQYLKFRKI